MLGIIDYGVGNLRSVQKGFEFNGHEAKIFSSYEELKNCSHIVLPGVGSFGKGMEALKEKGLNEAVIALVEEGRPLLGICLGFQFLFERSFEDGVYDGLKLLKGDVKKFDINHKVPHIGWNGLSIKSCELFKGLEKDGEQMYFVHSYYIDESQENNVSTTEYEINFTSAVNKDNIYGVQFHPEKSGVRGLKILDNFAKLK